MQSAESSNQNRNRNAPNQKNQKRKSDDQKAQRTRHNEPQRPKYDRQSSATTPTANQNPPDQQVVQKEQEKPKQQDRNERSNREKPNRGGNKGKLLETRSEILIDQLEKNQYECMVCCFVIRKDKAIWSCDKCFHIFHLYCIKKWASTAASKIEGEALESL